MSSNKISCRQALKILGGTAAGVAAASAFRVGASGLPGMAASMKRASSYQGEIVVYSHQDAQRMTPLIEAVQAQFPGITLDWRGLTSERYVELFSAAELAGDQIDIMHLNGQDARRYAVAGKLLDMSDIPYKDRFLPVSFDAYTINDKLWGAPHGGIAGFAFLFNKKLLDAIGLTAEPETYDDLLAIKPELEEFGRVSLHASGQEHLFVAGVAVLGARTDLRQQGRRKHDQDAARRDEVHRRRACGGAGNPVPVRSGRDVLTGRAQPGYR